MKKIIFIIVLFILSNSVFSQNNYDKPRIKIPYLLILNNKIPSNIRFYFFNLDSNYSFNFGCNNLFLYLIESDYYNYSKSNPNIMVKIEIIERTGNDIINSYCFNGKFNDLINKEYNLIEIKDTPLDKKKYIYIYKTPKYHKSYKWKKKYSSIDY